MWGRRQCLCWRRRPRQHPRHQLHLVPGRRPPLPSGAEWQIHALLLPPLPRGRQLAAPGQQLRSHCKPRQQP